MSSWVGEAGRWREVTKGEAGIHDHAATPTLKDFQQRFFDHLPAHVAPRTVAFYRDAFAPLVGFKPLASAKLNQIDKDLIDRFVRRRLDDKNHARDDKQ